MPDVIAFRNGQEEDTRLPVVAAAVAQLIGARARMVDLGELGDIDAETAVLDRLGHHDVDLGVMARGGDDALLWNVLTATSKPVLVVPEAVIEVSPRIRRILMPLDGAEETARAVAEFTSRLTGRPAITATHVINPDTVPSYWDQAAHAHNTWLPEFLLRHVPPGARLHVRRGAVTDLVRAEAETRGTDLILLAWKQELAADRAPLVKSMLMGTVPVVLVPARRGLSTACSGPSALSRGGVADQDSTT